MSAIITEDMIISYAKKRHFNMELFKKYLEYQKTRIAEIGENKWSIEEYAISEPKKDVTSLEFLKWFNNWMGFGQDAYCTPDYYSFQRYCACRDIYPFMDDENQVIYDEEYLGPGIIIINEKPQFLKMYYTGNTSDWPDYHITAKDENVDQPENEIREIRIETTKDEALYECLDKLYLSLKNRKQYSIDPSREGQNYFQIEKTSKGYDFVIAKDVYGVKEATDFINIYIGDHITTNNDLGLAIMDFYSNLTNVAHGKVEDIMPDEIDNAMLGLGLPFVKK